MTKNGVSRETPPIQSLDRGLVILEAVANSSNPVSLSDLTGVLGIDRSSVFRLANTLKRRGFLAYPAGRKDYILGPALWRLSHHYDWGTMLIRVSREHLKQLASQTNETAHLAVREGRQALFIDHAVANHVIAVSGQTGESVPLYCTAHGKALLADLDQKELTALFGNGPLRSSSPSRPSAPSPNWPGCVRRSARRASPPTMAKCRKASAAWPRRFARRTVWSSVPSVFRPPRSDFPRTGMRSASDQVRAVAEDISRGSAYSHRMHSRCA